jgi:DNA-binding transcriptional ArsR family regulator
MLLTLRRRDIYEFIREYWGLERFSSTIREISEHLGGLPQATVHEHLDALQAKGLIRKTHKPGARHRAARGRAGRRRRPVRGEQVPDPGRGAVRPGGGPRRPVRGVASEAWPRDGLNPSDGEPTDAGRPDPGSSHPLTAVARRAPDPHPGAPGLESRPLPRLHHPSGAR